MYKAPPESTLIYVRQSLDRSGDGLAVSRQREDCEQLAAQRGWTVVKILTDNDTSASGRKARPGFTELLDLIEAGRAANVIAWDWSRLSRNARDTLTLIEAGQRNGVTVALVRGSDLDMSTPNGRLVAEIMASVAKHEIDQKGDRQRRAVEQAAEKGLWVSGRKPFGYEPDGMTVRPVEAAAVKAGYTALLSGVPLGQIAREWNAQGFTAQSRPWAWDSVRRVLRNPRYAGLRALRGEVVGAAQWPALVSEETWRAALDVLAGNAARAVPRGAKRLLTGVGLCGVCDATVHAGGAANKAPMYRCSGKGAIEGGADLPGHVSRMALPVEEFVSAVVVERLSRLDAVELLADRGRPDTGTLRTDAAALRQRIENLALDYADGVLTRSQMKTANERLSGKLAEVESQLADAGRVSVLGPLIGAEDVRAVWDSLGVDRQRLVVDTLMVVRLDPPGRGTRTFRPETVRIEWR
ncbi:recombinase family protein [Actinocorallia aurantiaca]|uniref:Recombinase family protein n=1 Tax=Actinocorallia aurantiaca TaxID=46204 RepID=A0ABP6GQH4_9ACTN